MSRAQPGLSRRAKVLLSEGEGEALDYKRDLAGVTTDDLCAFANTSGGGAILIGVEEKKDPDGRQYGRPVGCPVDDTGKLVLLNKAQSCHPPIFIELHIERVDTVSFFRVEIPKSDTRPHCTHRGTYVTRAGSRNVALLPPDLLKVFLEREANAFQARFAEATQQIGNGVSETAELVRTLREDIGERIKEISSELGWADLMFDDTGDKIDRVEALATELVRRAVDTGSRLREIAATVGSTDPVKVRAMEKAKGALKTEILRNEDMIRGATTGDSIQVSTSGEVAEELKPEDLQRLFEEVSEEVLIPRARKEPDGSAAASKKAKPKSA